MGKRRSEVETVADTIACLDRQGYLLIPNGEKYEVLRELFGLTEDDVDDAMKRVGELGGLAPMTAGRTAEESSTRPGQDPKRTRWNVKLQRKERWCTGARVHDPHWDDEANFSKRADRPHYFRPFCDEAAKGYQRQRTMSAQAMPFIGQLGILLEVDDDSVVVGLKCGTCREPLGSGDTVKMHGKPHHAKCLQEALG